MEGWGLVAAFGGIQGLFCPAAGRPAGQAAEEEEEEEEEEEPGLGTKLPLDEPGGQRSQERCDWFVPRAEGWNLSSLLSSICVFLPGMMCV